MGTYDTCCLMHFNADSKLSFMVDCSCEKESVNVQKMKHLFWSLMILGPTQGGTRHSVDDGASLSVMTLPGRKADTEKLTGIATNLVRKFYCYTDAQGSREKF